LGNPGSEIHFTAEMRTLGRNIFFFPAASFLKIPHRKSCRCRRVHHLEEYLNVVKSYGAKDLTDRRITDYIWELDNTGLTISRISPKRYGKERVVRLGVPINIITRILEMLENG